MHNFTAEYEASTGRVRVTHYVGLLRVSTTVALPDYERRMAAWPSLYPDYSLTFQLPL
jgi:hypothetical protein